MSDNYVSVIFCRRCGSRYVEISEWTDEGKAVFHCRTCNNSMETEKFTLGRGSVTNKALDNARITSAKKKKYER
jgi:DNA-directed RNA polymerase subunit M/transcription elongation factor TFIIS